MWVWGIEKKRKEEKTIVFIPLLSACDAGSDRERREREKEGRYDSLHLFFYFETGGKGGGKKKGGEE